jgi:hypothetical protein
MLGLMQISKAFSKTTGVAVGLSGAFFFSRNRVLGEHNAIFGKK